MRRKNVITHNDKRVRAASRVHTFTLLRLFYQWFAQQV